MPRLNLAEDIKPVTEFRTHAATLIDRVRQTKRALVLTQRGHSTEVVIDVREYERLMEELELLRDIHVAEGQVAEGKTLSYEAARARVMASLAE